jgi:hypothetical protein
MEPIQERSGGSGGEVPGETMEIKIKTLDSQSYTIRVAKNVAVPALKEHLATVVGVPADSQRLICRGKVLKDDQLLSAYSILLHSCSLCQNETSPLTLLAREIQLYWLLISEPFI